jgi:nitrate/TMAO reductase-like tetraheme cytochrome c subunit
MSERRWAFTAVIALAGILVGAGLLIASVEVNRYTSTDGFCTSCHTMATLAADPHFVQSTHRANGEGVRATCADCHIPATSWFTETYAHAHDGIRDVVAQAIHNYNVPAIWELRRVELAHVVRDQMRREDSVTCRHCHDAAAIRPASEQGRAAHALLSKQPLTCIDCHFNLVHAPVPPSISFVRGSGLGGPAK